jgi:hypothetical protein
MMLLEAAAAAAFAAAAMTVYTLIMNKQMELSRRARDLDLIEAVVNQDINAIRHQARMWELARGPYSDTVRKNVTTSSVMTYNPRNGVCYTWESGKKGFVDKNFLSDLSNYSGIIPGAIDVSGNRVRIGSVAGYWIVRNYSVPVVTSTSVNGTTSPNNSAAQTFRVTYNVTIAGSTTQPFAFERTADIQIPAANFC